jgi:heme exporter protein D
MSMAKEFFDMGGYGAYIWTSYAVTIVVMVVMVITSLRGLRENDAALRSLEISIKDKS